jgi:nucleoside-diphosphate-sugar epimerase
VPCWKDRRRFSVIHADDLTRLLILVAQNGRRLAAHKVDDEQGLQGYYFAASDEAPTYAELGRMVAEAVGRSHWGIIPAPSPVVRMVAYASEIVSRMRDTPLFVNVDKAREITAGNWVCSIRKAISELGFQVGLPLLERLRQTATWYRREGWL